MYLNSKIEVSPSSSNNPKQFVDSFDSSEKVGIISGIGDRRLEDNKEIGSVAATMFDKIIIRQDKHLRGKTEEQIIAMVLEGIKQENSRMETTIIPSEKDAIIHSRYTANKSDHPSLWP